MMLPRPLVLFLAACGGGALFAAPLLLAAMLMSPPSGDPVAAAGSDAFVGRGALGLFQAGDGGPAAKGGH